MSRKEETGNVNANGRARGKGVKLLLLSHLCILDHLSPSMVYITHIHPDGKEVDL